MSAAKVTFDVDSNHSMGSIAQHGGEEGTHMVIHRGLPLKNYDDTYGRKKESPKTFKEKLAAFKDACRRCDRHKVLEVVEKKLPGVHVLRTYRFREYILGDIVSGVSVGILSVPLSMGFALLASVPPILGLYTCLYPAFIYFIFGASRHIAMGVMAISNLVIAEAVAHGTLALRDEIKLLPAENRTSLLVELEREQISIACSITFLSGLFLLAMSFMQLGFIVSYMGNAFISGYLTGSNIRVMTHQLIHCLGVKEYLGSHVGVLHYFYTLIDIFKNIGNTNIASLITSIVTLAILLAVKYGINDRFKTKLKIPVPIEMMVVVIGIIVSHYCDFNGRFGVIIVGYIPKGLPAPTLPSLQHMKSYALESCLCGIVSFVFSAMMVKLFCQRHNYPIDKNQELFASGMCNTISGMLSCIAVSVSPPRAFLMEMTGGKTQVSYLVNALFILLTLFALAPLLASLPICILACLIVTSCIPLFVHYKASITYWRTNKYDFAIWLVTCLANLGISVELGMVIGVGFSFMVVIYQSHNPYTSAMGYTAADGHAVDIKKFDNVQDPAGIKIYKFDSPLYFATLGVFKEKLYHHTVDPVDMKVYLHHQKHKLKKYERALAKVATDKSLKEDGIQLRPDFAQETNDDMKVEIADGEAENASNLHTPLQGDKEGSGGRVVASGPADLEAPYTNVHTIIVDCSAIPFADTPGVKFLTKFQDEYAKLRIRYVVAGVNEQVRALMSRVPECQELLDGFAFASVHDAVLSAMRGQPDISAKGDD